MAKKSTRRNKAGKPLPPITEETIQRVTDDFAQIERTLFKNRPKQTIGEHLDAMKAAVSRIIAQSPQ